MQIHFNFETTMLHKSKSLENDKSHGQFNYHLFPKTIGRIITNSGLKSMELTLTQGRWNHDLWGQSYAAEDSGKYSEKPSYLKDLLMQPGALQAMIDLFMD
jgi:hypothetical protein